MFEELNAQYFDGQLERPHIGWSHRSWRRQFGCYDPGPNHILLNRRLDRPGRDNRGVAGGKRLRPVLALAACEAVGGPLEEVGGLAGLEKT